MDSIEAIHSLIKDLRTYTMNKNYAKREANKAKDIFDARHKEYEDHSSSIKNIKEQIVEELKKF